MYKGYINEHRVKKWVPTELPPNVRDSDWPYAVYDFDEDFSTFLKEVESIPEKFWIKHRSKDSQGGYGHEGWSAAVLNGIDHTKTEYHARYGFETFEEAGYNWTKVNDFTPQLTAFLKNLQWERFERVRIMRLDPQGYIMPHTDGNSRMFGPFNIAVNNPAGCEFVFKKYGLVPHQQGRGIFLDVGSEHCIYNNSNEYRYHIIVHGYVNNEILKAATKQTYEYYRP